MALGSHRVLVDTADTAITFFFFFVIIWLLVAAERFVSDTFPLLSYTYYSAMVGCVTTNETGSVVSVFFIVCRLLVSSLTSYA